MTRSAATAEAMRQAERVAAEIAQECPWPTKYPQLVDLLAYAYARGQRDEAARVLARMDGGGEAA